MSKPIKANWQAIGIAYASGQTAEEIGELHGVKADTIRQRAKRQGWSRKALKEVDAELVAKGEKSPAVEPIRAIVDASRQVMTALAAQKEQFLASGAQVALTGMRKVAECMESESNIYTIGQLGEIGESFTRIAKPVFGLDSANVSVNLATQVNILSDLPPETLDWDAK